MCDFLVPSLFDGREACTRLSSLRLLLIGTHPACRITPVLNSNTPHLWFQNHIPGMGVLLAVPGELLRDNPHPHWHGQNG